MRRELLSAAAVAAALVAGLVLGLTRGPAGLTKPAPSAADPASDALAAELEEAVAEQFRLQDLHLATAGREPGAAAARASAERLGGLIARMEAALAAPVPEADVPAPKEPVVSFAILELDERGPWELARLRGNHAATLAYRYRLLRSRGSSSAKRAEAAKWQEEGRAELDKLAAGSR